MAGWVRVGVGRLGVSVWRVCRGCGRAQDDTRAFGEAEEVR